MPAAAGRDNGERRYTGPAVAPSSERGDVLAAREDVVEVDEVVLEAEAVEEPQHDDAQELPQPSRLPEPSRRTDVDAWRGEMRTAAIAAAGGLVAGAATVAAVRAVRSAGAGRRPRPRRILGRRPEPSIVASRSFLVDVHILGNGR
jgi:hypothetical protein